MLSYDIIEHGDTPLYEQLYQHIRHDIAHGAIAPGEKLPSKRALAKHLGVSVITVEGAYNQLVAEGYVVARQRSGYFACDLAPAAKGSSLPEVPRAKEPDRQLDESREDADAEVGNIPTRRATRAGARPATAPTWQPTPTSASNAGAALAAAPDPAPVLADLTRSSTATALFPYAAWAKTMRETLSTETSETLAQAASAAGSLHLRQAIAHHLRTTRGMDVQPRQIVIGAGSQTLYQLIIQLLGRRQRYAVEDPGYPLLSRMYRGNGVEVRPIPLDDQGIDVEALRASGAQVAHVMPSHQFPTGIITTAARRRQLLNWARENDAQTHGGRTGGGRADSGRFIIEDDYDSEFRMAGRPVPTLFSIDAARRVLYVNSFAKTLGDAFRLAYLVLPEHLVEPFEENLGFYSNTVSPIDQLTLARFIESGRYERHVNRLRTKARQAQNALVQALRESPLGERLTFRGLDGGLHFLMQVKDARTEAQLAAAAAREGVILAPLGTFREDGRQEGLPSFVARFDSISPDAAADIAAALTRAFGE